MSFGVPARPESPGSGMRPRSASATRSTWSRQGTWGTSTSCTSARPWSQLVENKSSSWYFTGWPSWCARRPGQHRCGRSLFRLPGRTSSWWAWACGTPTRIALCHAVFSQPNSVVCSPDQRPDRSSHSFLHKFFPWSDSGFWRDREGGWRTIGVLERDGSITPTNVRERSHFSVIAF